MFKADVIIIVYEVFPYVELLAHFRIEIVVRNVDSIQVGNKRIIFRLRLIRHEGLEYVCIARFLRQEVMAREYF